MTHSSSNARRLPGDLPRRRDQAAALRVDHAGEYGATRIYAGQIAVLKNHESAAEIKHMAEQEAVHLAEFNRILPEHGVRPTALLPLWHVGGWLMGAVSAAMGPRAAMACTVAVEEVITGHYNDQLNNSAIDARLRPTITKFRDEEMEHHAIGLANDAEKAAAYAPLTQVIKLICHTAIWISSRI